MEELHWLQQQALAPWPALLRMARSIGILIEAVHRRCYCCGAISWWRVAVMNVLLNASPTKHDRAVPLPPKVPPGGEHKTIKREPPTHINQSINLMVGSLF